MTRGAQIGRAYVNGRGLGTVFADPSPAFVTILLDKSDERIFTPRNRVNWRKN